MRAVLALVAVAALSATSGSQAAAPGIPAIYVNYNSDCTFTMSVDGGITVAPTATIPPGVYQLLVWMPNPNQGYTCGIPTLTFTGPGVSAKTVFAGQELHDQQVLPALQPSGTYVASDVSAPGATQHTLTVAATGSSSTLLASSSSSSGTGSNSQPDIVGSAVKQAPLALVASVLAAGKPSLKLGGRPVATLKAGRYEIEPDAAARRHGFVFSGNGRKITVTRAEEITFTPGRWTFTTGRAGPVAFGVQ